MSQRSPTKGGLVVASPAPLLAVPGSVLGLTLMSDLHLGALATDYGLIERELLEARANRDRILIAGDLFDAIFPADTKRYDPAALHPRLRSRRDMQNAVLEWATEILLPYADLIDGIGVGNHEASNLQKTSVDLIRGLIQNLTDARDPKAKKIAHLGYTGFVEYRVGALDQPKPRGRLILWVHHGAGRINAAPTHLGKLLKVPGSFVADVYWSGHSHARAVATETLIRVGRNGKVATKDIKAIITGGYLVSYSPQSTASVKAKGWRSTYGSEAGLAPHGLGGARLLVTVGKYGPERIQVVQ